MMKRFVRFTSDIVPFRLSKVDTKYPHCYMGAHRLCLRVPLPLVKYDTVVRLSWYGRYSENDWEKVDSACRVHVAPRWLRWFDFRTYYAGMYRTMAHLTIGKACLSIIPLTHGDCGWWL